MYIGRKVKPAFPRFTLYTTRHWCAIGRLNKVKLETGNYDTLTLRNWLGHSNIQTTMTYIRDAEQYMKRDPFDWFQRVLKFPTNVKVEEENTLKISTRPKKRVLTEIPSRSASGPEEICIVFSEGFQSKQLGKIAVSIFTFYFLKLFFFLFFKLFRG